MGTETGLGTNVLTDQVQGDLGNNLSLWLSSGPDNGLPKMTHEQGSVMAGEPYSAEECCSRQSVWSNESLPDLYLLCFCAI